MLATGQLDWKQGGCAARGAEPKIAGEGEDALRPRVWDSRRGM